MSQKCDICGKEIDSCIDEETCISGNLRELILAEQVNLCESCLIDLGKTE